MTDRVLNHCYRAIDVVSELRINAEQKDYLKKRIHKLNHDYQTRELEYAEFEKKLDHLLQGKSKKDWMRYYDFHMLSLMKKIEFFNHQIFYALLCDDPFGGLLRPDEAIKQLASVDEKALDSYRKKLETERKLGKMKTQISDEVNVLKEEKETAKKRMIERPKEVTEEKTEERPKEIVQKNEKAPETKKDDEEVASAASFEELFNNLED